MHQIKAFRWNFPTTSYHSEKSTYIARLLKILKCHCAHVAVQKLKTSIISYTAIRTPRPPSPRDSVTFFAIRLPVPHPSYFLLQHFGSIAVMGYLSPLIDRAGVFNCGVTTIVLGEWSMTINHIDKKCYQVGRVSFTSAFCTSISHEVSIYTHVHCGGPACTLGQSITY